MFDGQAFDASVQSDTQGSLKVGRMYGAETTTVPPHSTKLVEVHLSNLTPSTSEILNNFAHPVIPNAGWFLEPESSLTHPVGGGVPSCKSPEDQENPESPEDSESPEDPNTLRPLYASVVPPVSGANTELEEMPLSTTKRSPSHLPTLANKPTTWEIADIVELAEVPAQDTPPPDPQHARTTRTALMLNYILESWEGVPSRWDLAPMLCV